MSSASHRKTPETRGFHSRLNNLEPLYIATLPTVEVELMIYDREPIVY